MDNQSLANQAKTHVRLFFLRAERSAGQKISPFAQDLIIRKSLTALKKHLEAHRINQESVDPYKLYSFLLYAFFEVSPKQSDLDIRTMCRVVVCLLAKTVKRDTSARIDLSSKEIQYLISMIESEVTSMQHVGCLLYTSPSPRDA